MPSNSGAASSLSSDFSMTARATGSNIRDVAVLDIHMLSTADAAMNPNTMRRLLLPPNRFTMVRATRRWAPLFSIDVDKISPPNNSNTSELPYDSPTWPGVSTPTNGNTANGNNEVAGIGMASVTHQTAHNVVTPAVQHTADSRPSLWQTTNKIVASNGPATSASLRIPEFIIGILSSGAYLIKGDSATPGCPQRPEVPELSAHSRRLT